MAMFAPMLAAVGGGSAMAGAAAIGSTALQIGGQVSAARAAGAAGEANASMLRQQADMVRQQGSARQETQMRRSRELLGKQRAAIGQAGIGWGGSAGDLIEESETNAALDTMNIGYEAELQARGLLNQASIAEWEGKQQRKAGTLKAATSILGSAANYFGSGLSLGGAKPSPGDGLTQGDRRKIGVY